MGDNIREAVILAAGLSTRLRSLTSIPKFGLKINGLPLIYYPIKSLISSGVEKFTIVVATGFEKVARSIVSSINEAEFVIALNNHPERENGYTLLCAENYVKSKYFFVSVCDHIYPSSLPLTLKRKKGSLRSDILVGGDSQPKFVDVSEATKIKANGNNNVLEIGKGIEDYTHVDVGVFIMNNRVFSLKGELEKLRRISLSYIVQTAISRGMSVKVCDIRGMPWKDVDTPEDVSGIVSGRFKEVLRVWMEDG